jgi:magnesium transporter
MPELRWQYGYAGALIVMLTACGFLYWWFKRSEWL